MNTAEVRQEAIWLESGNEVPRNNRPYRPRASQATSFLMSRVRATDTRMEVELRSKLHRQGFRFRKNVVSLPGKPDIAFMRQKIAIFVDGDYWHARILKESGLDALRASLKTSNCDFWVNKLQRNSDRDIAVTRQLEELDWTVVRLWESDLKRNMTHCLRTIVATLEGRAPDQESN